MFVRCQTYINCNATSWQGSSVSGDLQRIGGGYSGAEGQDAQREGNRPAARLGGDDGNTLDWKTLTACRIDRARKQRQQSALARLLLRIVDSEIPREWRKILA